MKLFDSVSRNLSDFLERVTVWLVMAGVTVMAIDLFLSVLSRYVFRIPIVWADELALILLMWITFLGASLSIRRGEMVAVTVFADRLKGPSHKALQVVVQLLIIVFSAVMLVYSYRWVTSPVGFFSKTAALQVPVWVPNSIIPITLLVTIVFCIENIRRLFRPV